MITDTTKNQIHVNSWLITPFTNLSHKDLTPFYSGHFSICLYYTNYQIFHCYTFLLNLIVIFYSIRMGRNCAPFLEELYNYITELNQGIGLVFLHVKSDNHGLCIAKTRN
jgi:hypothetical protein